MAELQETYTKRSGGYEIGIKILDAIKKYADSILDKGNYTDEERGKVLGALACQRIVIDCFKNEEMKS
jgi:hypothetical protein